jgi:hypothetical protein
VLVLAHADGHCAIGQPPQHDPEVWPYVMARMLAALGLRGYSVQDWPPERAIAAAYAALDCEMCRPRLGCGCLPTEVEAGLCEHGGFEALTAAQIEASAPLN